MRIVNVHHGRYLLSRVSFRALCTGEKGISTFSQKPLYYKNSIIHRSITGFMIQGGGTFPIVTMLGYQLTADQTLQR